MTEELLPVGSIVKIRFSKNKYMILGYYVSDLETKEKYEYVAVEYPIGLININDVSGFPAKYVKKVLYRGLETENSKEFLINLKKEAEKSKVNNTVVKKESINKIEE